MGPCDGGVTHARGNFRDRTKPSSRHLQDAVLSRHATISSRRTHRGVTSCLYRPASLEAATDGVCEQEGLFMKKSSIAKAAAALAAAAAVTASAREASAINCNDASIKNPVYVTGSSAAEPILARLNTILLAQNPPVTIVYQKPGSCAGLTAIAGTPTALTGTATYGWDGTFTANATCTMQTPGPNPDVGVSDVFPATCPNVTLAATQKEFQGPIQ